MFVFKKLKNKENLNYMFICWDNNIKLHRKTQHSQGRQTYIFGSYQCQIELNHKDTQESGSLVLLLMTKIQWGKFQKQQYFLCWILDTKIIMGNGYKMYVIQIFSFLKQVYMYLSKTQKSSNDVNYVHTCTGTCIDFLQSSIKVIKRFVSYVTYVQRLLEWN